MRKEKESAYADSFFCAIGTIEVCLLIISFGELGFFV